MAKGEIIGIRGGVDFMIDAGTGDALSATDVPLARIFSRDTGGYLGEPLPVQSILARGYWETVEESGVVPEILDRVRAAIAAL